jgi:hypothetical protein
VRRESKDRQTKTGRERERREREGERREGEREREKEDSNKTDRHSYSTPIVGVVPLLERTERERKEESRDSRDRQAVAIVGPLRSQNSPPPIQWAGGPRECLSALSSSHRCCSRQVSRCLYLL